MYERNPHSEMFAGFYFYSIFASTCQPRFPFNVARSGLAFSFYQKVLIMAKPIKQTPTLRGQEAALFLAKMKQNSARKVSTQALSSIRNDAKKIKALLRTDIDLI